MKFLIFSLVFITIAVYHCAGQALTLEQLISRAAALEVNATAEVAALRAAGRVAAATELAREERLVRELVVEILRVNETSATQAELLRLETRLREREQTLANEIRRLAPATTSSTLSTLIQQATALEVRATTEVAALRAANRTAQANELAREEQAVRTLVAELLLVNELTVSERELLRLEERLREAELTLTQTIRRLSATTLFKRQALTITALVARATTLERRATEEIEVLRAAGRIATAAELQRQEREIQTLVTELSRLPAAASEAELRRLETRLAELETSVAAELRRLTA